MDKLQWSALEYEDKERSSDWFWALGVIVVTSSVAAIIFGNYFFAALLVLSGILLGFFAQKKPEIVTYELNSKGLKANTRLYPYENIKAFWVQINQEGEQKIKPILFIKSERAFMPILSIPIDDSIASDIHSTLTDKNIPEEQMVEHASDRIMESLGF
jgi:hypothetical protein